MQFIAPELYNIMFTGSNDELCPDSRYPEGEHPIFCPVCGAHIGCYINDELEKKPVVVSINVCKHVYAYYTKEGELEYPIMSSQEVEVEWIFTDYGVTDPIGLYNALISDNRFLSKLFEITEVPFGGEEKLEKIKRSLNLKEINPFDFEVPYEFDNLIVVVNMDTIDNIMLNGYERLANYIYYHTTTDLEKKLEDVRSKIRTDMDYLNLVAGILEGIIQLYQGKIKSALSLSFGCDIIALVTKDWRWCGGYDY